MIVRDGGRWYRPKRGEFEWDQSDDPYMINKTIPCPTPTMHVDVFCSSVHVDEWGDVHYCERPRGHTRRHYACTWNHYYIVAVWK